MSAAITVIDSGVCNLFSICNAFAHQEVPLKIAVKPEDVRTSGPLVLPGVGSFNAGIQSLRSMGGLDEAIIERVRQGTPILGICLGMQLLATQGMEGSPTDGLKLVPGRVLPLQPNDQTCSIPHIGWNDIFDLGGNRILESADLCENPDFYFVHSYHLERVSSEIRHSMVSHGGPFIGAFDAGHVFGTQFHPELSHSNGLKVLKAYAVLAGKL